MLGMSFSEGKEKAKKVASLGLFHTTVVSSILPIICAAYPKILAYASNDKNPENLRILENFMGYISAGLIFGALAYTRLLQARIHGDRWISSACRAVSVFCSLALCIGLLKSTALQEKSIGMNFLLQEFLTYISLEILYRSKTNQLPKFLSNAAAALIACSSATFSSNSSKENYSATTQEDTNLTDIQTSPSSRKEELVDNSISEYQP
jgi:Na+-driven multidrug efflux pump